MPEFLLGESGGGLLLESGPPLLLEFSPPIIVRPPSTGGVSDLFRHMVVRDHEKVSRVDAEAGFDRTVEIDVEKTTITSGMDDTVRNSADITISDPNGLLTPEQRIDLVSPFSARLRPYRGIRYPDGTEELMALYRLKPSKLDLSRESAGVNFRVTCYDESKVVQRKLRHPIAIEGGTPPEQAVAKLVTALLPTASFRLTETGIELPPLLIREREIAWNHAVEIARSAGCDLYFDRLGICAMDPRALQAKTNVAWEFVEGERGTHFNPQRSQDSEDRPNVIVVVGTHSSAPGVEAEVGDDDPTSPTFRGLDENVEIIESPLVATAEHAQAMAAGLLARALGPSDEVSFSAVPNPALDLGDTVAVTSPDLGLHNRRMLVTKITMPLGAEESMEVTCRRSILTLDDPWPVRGEA